MALYRERGRHDLAWRFCLERRLRYVGAISNRVDRVAKLTGQLLAFARRQALLPEVFDVGRDVASVSEIVGTLMGARITVTTAIEPFRDEAGRDMFEMENADPS